jgi:hypothetical protein
LAGKSLRQSWQRAEAKPTRSVGIQSDDAPQSNLPEQAVVGAEPLPEQETVTVPSHYMPRSEAERQNPNSNFNIVTGGGTPAPTAVSDSYGRVMDSIRYWAGAARGIAERAWYRTRGN